MAHIRPRGEDRANARSTDPLKRPRRWAVERRYSWLNRSRRLLVRWEKLERTYLAFVQLACALAVQRLLHQRGMPPPLFVTADDALLAAARAEGFPVDNPLQHP